MTDDVVVDVSQDWSDYGPNAFACGDRRILGTPSGFESPGCVLPRSWTLFATAGRVTR